MQNVIFRGLVIVFALALPVLPHTADAGIRPHENDYITTYPTFIDRCAPAAEKKAFVEWVIREQMQHMQRRIVERAELPTEKETALLSLNMIETIELRDFADSKLESKPEPKTCSEQNGDTKEAHWGVKSNAYLHTSHPLSPNYLFSLSGRGGYPESTSAFPLEFHRWDILSTLYLEMLDGKRGLYVKDGSHDFHQKTTLEFIFKQAADGTVQVRVMPGVLILPLGGLEEAVERLPETDGYFMAYIILINSIGRSVVSECKSASKKTNLCLNNSTIKTALETDRDPEIPYSVGGGRTEREPKQRKL